MRAAADEPDVKRKLLEVGQVDNNGKLPEWPNGADCKSAGLRLRWFESITSHSKKRMQCRLEARLLENADAKADAAGTKKRSLIRYIFAEVAQLIEH